MAGLTYNNYVQQLCLLAVVPSQTVGGVTSSTDSNFNALIPEALEYAELRIQRDLDLLSTVTPVNITATAGSSTASFTQGVFVTVQDVNVITPAGTTVADSGTRNPLLPVTKEYMQYVWPSSTGASVPETFAMLDDHTFYLGPWPNNTYTIEVIGTIRPATLSSTNTTTFISQYLPDLLLMASMIYVSGYQRNFGRLNDDPQMAVTYESQYQALLKGATMEEYRKKFAASAWTSMSPSPVATPTRG